MAVRTENSLDSILREVLKKKLPVLRRRRAGVQYH